MNVYLNGKKISLRPKQSIGKGGEADVFNIGGGQALKLFKPPDHPDYAQNLQEQQAASDRLAQHQQKLRQFPKNLPSRVVQPTALVTDARQQQVLGYTMPLLTGAEVLLRYGQRSFRQAGITPQMVVEIFQDLHRTVSQIHAAQVVIGDFNDLNVLVKGTEAFLIDADSFQFGAFLCPMFMARFVDPLLCDPQASQPQLQQPHTANSDWYAFAVMLMQCLLYVDPYGGIYKPQDPSQRVPQTARSLHRITIFHPEVRYPKPAIPYGVLPDDLLHYFHQVFEQDQRGPMPRSLLDNLRWTTCGQCGADHARDRCPHCTVTRPTPAPQLIQAIVRGTVTITPRFQLEGGVILAAAMQQGHLHWLYHHQGQFWREGDTPLMAGDLDPTLRFGLQGTATLCHRDGQLITLSPGQPPQRLAAQRFAISDRCRYWTHNGQLWRDGSLGPAYVGGVLPEQTRFWVGDQFGLGFYRASRLQVAFVFDKSRPGLNDRVALPAWSGQLIEATCTFSGDRGWLFLTIQEQGYIHYRCVVIQASGQVLATAQARQGEDHWLARIGGGGQRSLAHTCPHCAIGTALLAATDDGIYRIELHQGQLIHAKTFPDTEPFVDSSSHLLPAPDGLYVVDQHQIRHLSLAPVSQPVGSVP